MPPKDLRAGRVGDVQDLDASFDVRGSIGNTLASHESVVAADLNARHGYFTLIVQGCC